MQNERLRATLIERGITPAELADRVEVDPKTVERWITAGRPPHRRTRYQVAATLGVDEADLWPGALSPAQRATLSANELVALYPHRWAVPDELWRRLFSSAQQYIDILVYSGLFLAEDTGVRRLLAAKARAGVRIRLLLGDPTSKPVAERGTDEGIDDAMAARIRNALVLLRPLVELSGVELRLHRTVLYNSIYRADDQALVNPHVHGVGAPDAPVLHLRRVAGGDLLALYADSVDRIWAGATPLT